MIAVPEPLSTPIYRTMGQLLHWGVWYPSVNPSTIKASKVSALKTLQSNFPTPAA